jgi:hypothetical protein
VPVFDNINVYALVAKVMRVKPLPNAGSSAATAAMLQW